MIRMDEQKPCAAMKWPGVEQRNVTKAQRHGLPPCSALYRSAGGDIVHWSALRGLFQCSIERSRLSICIARSNGLSYYEHVSHRLYLERYCFCQNKMAV
jgi:hypothetical protein